WTSASTLVPLTVAVVLLLAFLQVERTTERDPLVRLGLLTNRSVAGANLFNLLLGAAMASAFYFISLYLQRVLHHGPARTRLGLLSVRPHGRRRPLPGRRARPVRGNQRRLRARRGPTGLPRDRRCCRARVRHGVRPARQLAAARRRAGSGRPVHHGTSRLRC